MFVATVTHYIYSHYEPKQREHPERETGHASEEEDVDSWQTESSFGPSRRIASAPRFVPAIVSYDEINNMMGLPSHVPESRPEPVSNDISNWYKGLTGRVSASPPADAASVPSLSAPVHDLSSSTPTHSHADTKPRRPDKNDWFITNALRSQPPSGHSTPTQTLADILSRDPPPRSDEQRFKPPVFLVLGPSNKGFAMLQQSGWSEGEPLGPGVARRRREEKRPMREVTQEARVIIKEEEQEVKYDPDEDISEVRKVDFIDLTLSEDEEEVEIIGETRAASVSSDIMESSPVLSAPPSYNPTALLTPLPTVLKSDRLGVGLKAKTVGPYKASKKRVTHNEAALAAHVRATEEMRKMKKLMGRGTKGFARVAKAETEQRRKLLANLNEG